MANNTKLVVDAKTKRQYKAVTNGYGALLNKRLNNGRMDEERFWRLQDKLTQWHKNFNPVVEVNDFSSI